MNSNKTFFLSGKAKAAAENNGGTYVQGGRDFGVLSLLFSPVLGSPRSPGHCRSSGG